MDPEMDEVDYEILTIEDLKKVPSDIVEAVRQSISLESLYKRQANMDGLSVGLTAEEYWEIMSDKGFRECPTCHGEGEIPKSKPRSVGALHSSSAHQCVTRLYHEVLGEIRPIGRIPYNLQLTFDIGHVVHGRIQQTLHNLANWDLEVEAARRFTGPGDKLYRELVRHTEWASGFELEFADEVEVNFPDIMIERGHADGVAIVRVYLPEFDLHVRARVLLEIKSIGESSFQDLTGPLSYHLVQAEGIYATALSTPFTSFLYSAKSFDAPMLEFVRTYSSDVFDDWIRTKFLPLEEALAAGSPPRPDAKSEWECKECPFGYACPVKLRSKYTRASQRSGRL